MTTIEKLFVQIFEQKNRIIEQVKLQEDLYSQHLASKLLIDGITPPPWLWNPNYNSESSDPKELKKEELISELLLPHPRPAVPYLGGHCSLYNKPVVIGDNGQLPEALLIGIHASNKGFNTVDRPTTVTKCHDNDIVCSSNCVPELDLSDTSPQGQIEVKTSNIYTVPDQSLARIQRSKSRQKALELRKTAKAAVKSRLIDGNDPDVYSSRIKISKIASQQLDHHDNELLEFAKYSDTISDNCAVRRAIGECLSKEKDANTYCGRITRSRKSCNLSSHESKSLKLYNSSDIAKEDSCRMIKSQSTCIEGISKPVHLSNTTSQRITRSKFGASEVSQLANSLNRSERFHLQNVSGGEVTLHCPESIAIVNQEGKADSTSRRGTSGRITETELISDGPVEAQAACSESNMDAAGLSVGLEVFVSRPSYDCSMSLKPKTLDFDDMEKCSLNEIYSPMLENERLDKSSEKRCCTSVKSTTSLHNITFDNPSRKSLEKQSLKQEVPNKTTEAWRISFETCAEECVEVDAEVSKSKTNKNIKNVEDKSESVQEIEDSPVSHGGDVAQSIVSKDLDVEMHQKVMNVEDNSEVVQEIEDSPVSHGVSSDAVQEIEDSPVSHGAYVALSIFSKDLDLEMHQKVKNVEDNSEAVQDIEDSPVSHGEDVALSIGSKDLDVQVHQTVKCHLMEAVESSPKLQVEECKLGFDGRDRSETTPFLFKHQQLKASFVSSLTKHSTVDQSCLVGGVGVTDPNSFALDVRQWYAADNQDLMCFENKPDKGRKNGLVCQKKSHVREDGFLACGSVGSLHCKDKNFSSFSKGELQLLEKSLMPGRKLKSATENSQPQFKRRKIEGQQTNFFSASPSFRVKDIHSIGGHTTNRYSKSVGDNLGNVLQFQFLPFSHEGDVAQSNVDKSPDVEIHQKVKCHLTKGIEPSLELQLEQDEVDFEERNQSTNTPLTFKHGQLGPSVVSSLTKEAAGDFQGCSVENRRTADTTSIILDESIQGDERNYKNLLHSENKVAMENKDDLTHTERILQETIPHFKEDGLFSCCSAASPQDNHLGSMAADQTMPEFERFVIDAEENGQPHIVEDAFSFDKFNPSSNTIERASVLEELCKSASMYTPLSQFSTTFKLHRISDLYQSVPNGLLEHMDPRSTLNLNDGGGKQLRASYSSVDEVKCAFQGSSYSDCVQYSNGCFGWSLKNPPLSPVGKLWDRILSNSSSSEKQRSLNPELTCFPIEEDPSISEENENSDEVADTTQEDICSTLLNCGAKREPLAEITEACVNPPTSVSAAERFADRNSLDSVNTEISFTGTHSRVKQKLGNCHSGKRRCTNEAKKNRTLSVSTNYIKNASESLNNRFSKPKLSGKTSLRKGGQSFSKRESKYNNIVSNITSFVPLVQPKKQAAAVVTGKRDIKVKALDAAEAAKRLEEKREIERKMKKEALKLERARIEQENLQKMELKMKKKEEEQKKKAADMAARKRMREEEEKEKERKRKRTEEARRQQREQKEKLRVGKVEKEDKKLKRGLESNDDFRKHQKIEKERGDDNIMKKPQTESRVAEILTSDARQAVLDDCGDTGEPTSVLTKTTENDDLAAKTSREKSYEISPYQCSDDEDDEEDEIPTKKFIPSWASKNSVANVISSQHQVDPDTIFPPESFCSIDQVIRPQKLPLK